MVAATIGESDVGDPEIFDCREDRIKTPPLGVIYGLNDASWAVKAR
jgi:hypothetical protein